MTDIILAIILIATIIIVIATISWIASATKRPRLALAKRALISNEEVIAWLLPTQDELDAHASLVESNNKRLSQ